MPGVDEPGGDPTADETVVRAYLQALNEHDPDRIVSFVSEDYVSEHVAERGTGLVGRHDYRARLDVFLADFPEIRYEVLDLIAARHRVAVHYRMSGLYARAGPEAVPFSIHGAFWFLIRDGAIAHRIDFRDSITFERQVGLADPK